MKLKLFALVVVLQSLWVIATVARQETHLTSGQLIRLETRPVDPRDLLRGDFVTLSYDISTVPRTLFAPPVTDALALPNGRTVYVELQPDGEFHHAVRASLDRFEPAPENLIVKGEVFWPAWMNPQRNAGAGNLVPGFDSVRLNYGLERFYVREGTGNPSGKVTVEASVSKSGDALIHEVFLDGQPYADAMKARVR